MPSTEFLVGLIGPALQVWLAVAMVRLKLHRHLPAFFAYTLYSVLVIAIRLSVVSHARFYYGLFWITDVIYGGLALLSIREVFDDLSAVRSSRNELWRIAQPAVLSLLAVTSFCRAIYHPFGLTFLGKLGAGAYFFDLEVLGIQAITYILTIFRLKPFSDIPHNQHKAAILKGFGIFGLVAMSSHLARSLFGSQFEGWFRYIPPGAYFMATLTWLSAFRHPEPPKVPVLPSLESTGGPTRHDADQRLDKIEKNLATRPPLTGGAIQHVAGLPVAEPAQHQVVYAHSTTHRDCAGPRLECPQT